MFWVPLLLLACTLAALSCGRLCLAAVQAAAGETRGRHTGRQLTLYEAAFLSGGPARVADVALLSMARGRRLLLAHTGWATVVDPVAGDDVERSVLGAIGPAGQSRIAPVRRATAAADCVRALADRLVAAGLAVPDGAWSGIAGAVRQVRAAAVAVTALGVCATLLPGPGSGGGEGQLPVAVWFALPFFLTVSSLAIARFEVPATRWASPAGQRLLGALPSRDDLTSVAVRGLRALDDPALRAALSHRDPNLDGYRESRHGGH
ncbi:membrane protein [Streptomyces aureoverticillatus]|nr:membrane protein [Streptomyces aureoverticillatus]